jgi:hypothetical protein
MSQGAERVCVVLVGSFQIFVACVLHFKRLSLADSKKDIPMTCQGKKALDTE